jgi:hypothetical protein
VATLRDTLQKLACNLELTRAGVDEITSQVARLREGVAALGDLQQREATSVGVEMLVDAAVDWLAAFRALDSGLLDAQGDVDTLETAIEDDEEGRQS